MSPNHWMTLEGSGTVVFPFLSLQGALIPTQATFERELRSGVDGIGSWLTGVRGEPFQIITTLDCVSVAAAATALAAYKAAVPNKRDLYYCGVLFATVQVQRVNLVSISKIAAAVGGIQNFAGGSGALLTAQWTLEALT